MVAQGVCLGLESIQGTDAMLDFVARTGARVPPRPRRRARRALQGAEARPGLAHGPAGGRPGHDARRGAAGLAGVVVQAGGVLVLGRAETVAAADAAGLFLWGREAGE